MLITFVQPFGWNTGIIRRVPFPQHALGGVAWGHHHPHLHEFNSAPNALPRGPPVQDQLMIRPRVPPRKRVTIPRHAVQSGQWNGLQGHAVNNAMVEKQQLLSGLVSGRRTTTPTLPPRKQHFRAFGKQTIAFSAQTGLHIMKRTSPVSMALPNLKPITPIRSATSLEHYASIRVHPSLHFHLH